MGSGGTTALRPPGKFFVLCTQFFIASAALPALVKSVTYFSMLLPFLRLPPCCCANHCVLNSESLLKIVSHPPKHLRRCKVKPHGSLVPVSIRTSDTSSNPHRPPSQAYRTLPYPTNVSLNRLDFVYALTSLRSVNRNPLNRFK